MKEWKEHELQEETEKEGQFGTGMLVPERWTELQLWHLVAMQCQASYSLLLIPRFLAYKTKKG